MRVVTACNTHTHDQETLLEVILRWLLSQTRWNQKQTTTGAFGFSPWSMRWLKRAHFILLGAWLFQQSWFDESCQLFQKESHPTCVIFQGASLQPMHPMFRTRQMFFAGMTMSLCTHHKRRKICWLGSMLSWLRRDAEASQHQLSSLSGWWVCEVVVILVRAVPMHFTMLVCLARIPMMNDNTPLAWNKSSHLRTTSLSFRQLVGS